MIWKALENGRSCNGGDLAWSLPTQNADGTWTPGEWMPAIEGELVPCENGYHGARDAQVLEWLGPELYEMEYRGEVIAAYNKVVGREARLLRRITAWDERSARLFAAWCARKALSLVSNPDPRSVTACDVAERSANGEATRDELAAARAAARAAAGDAARAAAWAAAWDAAWDAAGAAAWDAARAAAGDAARAAAGAAAWDAAGDAAGDAARAAAWDAAGDAARDAAWDAARAAAWAAAWDAAWDAARDAETKAQYAHLCEMLEAGQ